MDTLQCAIVLAKLERFEWELQHRLEIGARYQQMLAGVPGVQRLAVRADRDCVWGQYTVFVERRKELQAALQAEGVPTAVHYPKPLHRQPVYAGYAPADACPHSVAAAERVMSLPMSADLTEVDQETVVAELSRALSSSAR